jgi:hypothetical protein
MNYLTEVPSSCGLENTNVAAFIEATSLIGGRVVMEEFLAFDLWPLGQQFGFQVERKESPLSKVLVSMPQITAAIEEWESEAKFVVRIEDAANELVARYNIMEHNAYQGLQHGRLNRIFELARILCQPCPKPVVRKHKSAAAGMTSTLRKTSGRCGHSRRSSRSEGQTSAQGLALAKALKPNKKFAVKTSVVGVEATGKKTLCTSACKSGMTHALKHALDLFGSDSSASDGETIPIERPRKRSKETSLA